MRTVLLLLVLAGCNKQTKPATPHASLVYKSDSAGYPRLGPTVLAGRSFAVQGGWSGECTEWHKPHNEPLGRSGRQTCDRKAFTLSASCEPACNVRVEDNRAWILPTTSGVHRIMATLQGPTVANFELATTVVTARALVISDCIIAQKPEAVYAMPTGTVCRIGSGRAIYFSVLASNMPIEPGLERFAKDAQAMHAALGDYPDYKTLAAYTGPIVDKFGVDVTINGKQVRFIQAGDLEELGRPVGPAMYAVTVEYKDVRTEVTFEVLPPDLSP